MEYKPRAERRARDVLERIFIGMDKKERDSKPKPPRVNGTRKEFLEKYKVEGYEKAKKAINAKFGKEVYTDEILNGWIEENEQ